MAAARAMNAPSHELMAFDVLAVMDHLQLEKAAFVGWSDGA
jgi:pimeloyl-ACP methyl ester carboxylesterase